MNVSGLFFSYILLLKSKQPPERLTAEFQLRNNHTAAVSSDLKRLLATKKEKMTTAIDKTCFLQEYLFAQFHD